MHDTLNRLHGRPGRKGTTIDHFRLNEVVSQIAFAGRRSRVYRRIVSLSGVQPEVVDRGALAARPPVRAVKRVMHGILPCLIT